MSPSTVQGPSNGIISVANSVPLIPVAPQGTMHLRERLIFVLTVFLRHHSNGRRLTNCLSETQATQFYIITSYEVVKVILILMMNFGSSRV